MILQAWQFCDEDTLIFRTQIGERSAFDPLVTKYRPKIEALLMRQVHHRETAEDLTQETFVKAFSRINTFRGECAFYTWLYQIAQNVCIDYHRRQQARAKTFSSEAARDTLIGTDTHPCPSHLMEQKELRAILGQAVLHLPPMRRRVFQFRGIGAGFPYQKGYWHRSGKGVIYETVLVHKHHRHPEPPIFFIDPFLCF